MKRIYLNKVDSTNSYAMKGSFKESTLIYTYDQRGGRGSRGRRWQEARNKSLAISFLLLENIREDFVNYTVLAALALARTLIAYGLEPRIKYPNDVLLEGKKLAGILTEASHSKDRVEKVVIGVGVNINQAIGDFPLEISETATSLRIAIGLKQDREAFTQKLIDKMLAIVGENLPISSYWPELKTLALHPNQWNL